MGGKTYATYQRKIISGKKPGDERESGPQTAGVPGEESGCWGTKDISVSFEEIGPEGFEDAVKKDLKPEELILTSEFVR